MEGKRLIVPKGVTDFGRLRDGGYYYVDKSELISDIVGGGIDGGEVYLFTRPRRFGKSLNLSMIDCFFNLEYKGNGWFDGLGIMRHPEAVARMGSRPVIHIDMKSLSVDSRRAFISDLGYSVSQLFTRYDYLMDYEAISDVDLDLFRRGRSQRLEDSELRSSLKLLCKLLNQCHGIPPLLLIDEYDDPINDAYRSRSYNGILAFLKAFYTNALKGNPDLGFAVVTGVMQIAKESIFSDMNNLFVNNIFSKDSDERYGFTSSEVQDMCSYYGSPEAFAVAREWYDGYRFGGADIYNPWSLVNFIQRGFEPKTYWAGTGGNEIIPSLLMNMDDDAFRDLQDLGNGHAVTDRDVKETVAMSDPASDPDSIFSILVMSGYLNAVPDNGFYDLSVPNREMYDVFADMIISKCIGGTVRTFTEFFDAAERNDVEVMERSAFSIFARNFQDWDLPDEGAYRRILAGAAMSRCGRYTVSSEGQSGNGRSDLLMVRNSPQVPNIVMEFKKTKVDDPDVQLADAEEGLRRIKTKEYFFGLEGRTIIYGIAMRNKKARIVSEEMTLSRARSDGSLLFPMDLGALEVVSSDGFKSSAIESTASERAHMDDDELKELTDLMMVFPRKMIYVNRAVVSKYFKDSRIKPYHLMLVKGIGVNEGISQKELGAMVPFDKSYISIGVRELIDMGFVRNDSVGKAHRLVLTESGRDLVSMADMMFDITGNAVMGVFTHEEIDELTKLMRKLNSHIDGVLAKYAADDS